MTDSSTPYVAADWLAAAAKRGHADIWVEPAALDGYAMFAFECGGKVYQVEISEHSTVMGVVRPPTEDG